MLADFLSHLMSPVKDEVCSEVKGTCEKNMNDGDMTFSKKENICIQEVKCDPEEQAF